MSTISSNPPPITAQAPVTGCASNPLIKPLLAYNRLVVSTCDQITDRCLLFGVIRRIAVIIVMPLAYLALSCLALVGMTLNLMCRLEYQDPNLADPEAIQPAAQIQPQVISGEADQTRLNYLKDDIGHIDTAAQTTMRETGSQQIDPVSAQGSAGLRRTHETLRERSQATQSIASGALNAFSSADAVSQTANLAEPLTREQEEHDSITAAVVNLLSRQQRGRYNEASLTELNEALATIADLRRRATQLQRQIGASEQLNSTINSLARLQEAFSALSQTRDAASSSTRQEPSLKVISGAPNASSSADAVSQTANLAEPLTREQEERDSITAAVANLLSRQQRGRYNEASLTELNEALATIADLRRQATQLQRQIGTSGQLNSTFVSLARLQEAFSTLIQTREASTPSSETAPQANIVPAAAAAAVPAPAIDLDEANRALGELVRGTPEYVHSDPDQFYVVGNYNGKPFSKEYLDVVNQPHQIFEHVYLGGLRAMMSVDPEFFAAGHTMTDSLDRIFDSSGLSPELARTATRYLEQQLDQNGSRNLGIKRILSVTQFTPKNTVEADDWSRFEPNLEALRIERLQINVDDDEFAWEGIEPHLEEAFEFIDRARADGVPLLVHCVKGASRSVTVLTAYLMKRCGLTVDQAFGFIKTKRTIAELKPSIETGLRAYQSTLN